MAKIFKNVSEFVLHIEKTVQTLLKNLLKFNKMSVCDSCFLKLLFLTL